MKTFYVNVSVKFTDNSEELPWNAEENYSLIIQDDSKKEAKKEAKKQAKEQFDEEINVGFDDVVVTVNEIYQTADDARSS